jgi:two-component system NtrC family sensor kinase
MKAFRSLSVRVFAGSFLLLMILLGLYSYFAIKFHTDQMMQIVQAGASRISNVIKNSTHYSMLLNRKEDVYQTILTIGKEPGVEGIRIYNKRGEIMFSSNTEEKMQTVDMHTEACYVCHEREKPLQSLATDNRMRIYTSQNGYRVLGLINPIHNEPICSNADCHAHPADKTVLGVLDVRMSLESVDATMAEARAKLIIWAIGGVLLFSLVISIFLYRTVHRPVKQLTFGTREISSGNLNLHIPIHSKDELGQLAESFNSMTTSLRNLIDENNRWSRELEERVREKTAELQHIHEQILQIEKMTSLGKLSATVAHELNNPLEGILTYAKLIVKQLRKIELPEERSKEFSEELDLIIQETARCGNIVKNLLLFSRKQVGEFAVVPVQQIVEKARRLVDHHFHISNVHFNASYSPEDTEILCDEQQIQQALIALFVNAVEAMPGGGDLHIATSQQSKDDNVVIRLTDTGIGIAEEDIQNIFEPFFTTKKEGKGVGLGLSVVYGIVVRHGGTINVQSQLNKGTIFTITFPPIQRHPSGNPKSEKYDVTIDSHNV